MVAGGDRSSAGGSAAGLGPGILHAEFGSETCRATGPAWTGGVDWRSEGGVGIGGKWIGVLAGRFVDGLDEDLAHFSERGEINGVVIYLSSATGVATGGS